MMRSMEVLIAGGILFAGGSLAGQFLLSAPDSPDLLPAETTGSQIESAADSDQPQQFAEFFWSQQPATAVQTSPQPTSGRPPFQTVSTTVETVADVSDSALVEPDSDTRPDSPAPSAEQQQKARMIQQALSGADAETAAIWSQQYADLPLGDIEFLLEQKQQVGTVLPESLAVEPSLPDVVSPQTESQLQRAILLGNLQHAATPGYRSRLLLTSATDLTTQPTSGQSPPQADRVVFDFGVGRLLHTADSGHLAIPDDPDLMFVLEPGNVLTRCGLLQRLEDGRPGICCGGEALALVGCTAIPADALQMNVDNDGRVSYQSADGLSQSAGQIVLARLPETGRLHSDDGVFFQADNQGSLPLVRDHAAVRSGWLELSNVKIRQQQKLLQTLDSVAGQATF